ncbi:MAG: pyridoxal phosphate-dependent aminotransferase [Burkholderiaceae bacterium]
MSNEKVVSLASIIPFTPLVRRLPASTPFVGPEALERQRGNRFLARIGANESAFGISPAAREAMIAALDQTAWYGDPENFELRAMLAERHQVTADAICVDAGIDSLLGLTVRMLLTPGAAVVTSLGAYPTFNYHVAGFGGQLVTVPYLDDHEDPEGLLSAAREHHAPLIYLANPDNPMGTWHSGHIIQSMIDRLPATTILALDEAYAEFAPPDAVPKIDISNPQVMRFRTFSKAWGMAGARIGYAIAHPELITGLNKIRNHFAVSRIAQAGAVASLQDPGFLLQVAARVTAGRQQIYAMAADHGLRCIESATNFVAIDVGSPDRAAAVMNYLLNNDVFIRMPAVPPLSRCVRIGVGTPQEQAVLSERFAAALHATRSQAA